jgi:hypothetical protein
VVLLASFFSGENDRGGVLAPEFLRPRRDILLKIDLPDARYRIVYTALTAIRNRPIRNALSELIVGFKRTVMLCTFGRELSGGLRWADTMKAESDMLAVWLAQGERGKG